MQPRRRRFRSHIARRGDDHAMGPIGHIGLVGRIGPIGPIESDTLRRFGWTNRPHETGFLRRGGGGHRLHFPDLVRRGGWANLRAEVTFRACVGVSDLCGDGKRKCLTAGVATQPATIAGLARRVADENGRWIPQLSGPGQCQSNDETKLPNLPIRLLTLVCPPDQINQTKGPSKCFFSSDTEISALRRIESALDTDA